MSRRTSSRHRTASSGQAHEPTDEIVDGISFHPVVSDTRKLSVSEYNLRSKKCTEDQLQKLQATPEFQTWQRQRSAANNPLLATFNRLQELLPRSMPPSTTLKKLAIGFAIIMCAVVLPKNSLHVSKNAHQNQPVPVTRPVKETTIQTPNPTVTSIVDSATNELLLAEYERRFDSAKEKQSLLIKQLEAALAREAVMSEEAGRLQNVMMQQKQDYEQKLKNHQNTQQQQRQPQSRFATIADVQDFLSEWDWTLNRLLLAVELGLLALSLIFLRSNKRARSAIDKATKQYRAACQRQRSILARAEDVYQAAQERYEAVQGALEKQGFTDGTVHVHADKHKQDEEGESIPRLTWASAAAQLLSIAVSPTKQAQEQDCTSMSPEQVAQLLSERYTELQERIEAAQRDRDMATHKTSEMMTDNELLKQQLMDSKKAFANAAEMQAAAAQREEQVKNQLEEATKSLATVTAERATVAKQAAELEKTLQEEKARVTAVNRSGEQLENQIEQLELSLAAEASSKSRAEQRAAHLDAELSSLKILAESLELQVKQLQDELIEAQALQEELRAASKQLAAIETETSTVSPEIRQAAIDRLTSAERRMKAPMRTSPIGDDVSPLPISSAFMSDTRSRPTPITPHSERAASLSIRAGKIADMLAESLDLTGAASPTKRLFTGNSNNGSSANNVSLTNTQKGSAIQQRLARASEYLNVAERMLGQKLPENANSPTYQQLLASGTHRSIQPFNEGGFLGEEGDDGTALLETHVMAAMEDSRREIAQILKQLATLHSVPEAASAIGRLKSAQQSFDEAFKKAMGKSQVAAELRQTHAQAVEIAHTRQKEMEDAHKALQAAMSAEENVESLEEKECKVALIAKMVTECEAAQATAANTAYDAERALNAATQEHLSARNALRQHQDALHEATHAALTIVTAHHHHEAAGLPAVSVSPRLPIGEDVFDSESGSPAAEALSLLYDRKFRGALKEEVKQAAAMVESLSAQASPR